MLKMTTYPGMSLGGEVRESISLDEDDLSDVEDEVFIRDGKNSYKLAEELNVKRPLMPPRRKLGKPDITSRLKTRPPCKALCKPCCYILTGLSILIGLIVLVVILVSIFPLPLDKFRNWLVTKSAAKPIPEQIKLLPCNHLKITEIWSANLPLLTTDSPVRIVDMNKDGIDDVIFGFGTGDNYDILPSNLFCSIIMGVSPPCQGGVVALNGINGQIEWRYWTNDTIFDLHCNEDLNGDNSPDCLAVGVKGTMTAINTKNGTIIWRNANDKMDVFVANFISDQNNDSIADILSSHTNLQDNEGHLVLISGKTGKQLQQVPLPNHAKTFYMPQHVDKNNTTVLFGTGSPISGGTLNVTPLNSIVNGNLTSRPIYVDHFKGVFTQSILVDLTGDGINDIVTAMYNSTIVAINGQNFQQLWNFTIANSVTNIIPTPGYFNYDNITDFLIIYQKYDNILKYNYSNTFIIDGKTGKSIYESPIAGSVLTQMSGLTLSMEGHGYDMFVFWTTECENIELLKNNQIITKGYGCKQFNTSNMIKLNALNQCDQPPGFEIYSSVNKTLEFIDLKSPMKQIREYLTKHFTPEQGQAEIDENYGDNSQKLRIHKYGSSNFRHKDDRQGIVKDYMNNNEKSARINDEVGPKYSPNYDWQNPPQNLDNSLPGDIDNEFNNYEDNDNSNLFNQKLFDEINGKNTRDPRSKIEINQFMNDDFMASQEATAQPTTTTTTTTKYGIYDYQNIKMARNRLLRDLNNVPNEILLDTFLKNRESQLRKSRFEQRDINSHIDHIKEKEYIKEILDEEKQRVLNTSFTLWDLESEKELQERQKDNWRTKREINSTVFGIRKVTSVGALLRSLNQSGNSIDIVFVTYWQSPKMDHDDFAEKQIADCVEQKFSNFAKDKDSYSKTTEMEQKSLFTDECLTEQNNLRNQYPYFNDLHQLRLGQMTVYRLRIECECNALNHERCAKFLPYEEQSWSSYLGRNGDGKVFTRN